MKKNLVTIFLSLSILFAFGGNNVHAAETDRFFTGQRNINDTGVYHFGARFYSPTLGIFIQPDKIEDVNRYSYVKNNPVNMVDAAGSQASPVNPDFSPPPPIGTPEPGYGNMNPTQYQAFMNSPSGKASIGQVSAYAAIGTATILVSAPLAGEAIAVASEIGLGQTGLGTSATLCASSGRCTNFVFDTAEMFSPDPMP